MKLNNATVLNVVPKVGTGKFAGRTFYTLVVSDPFNGNLKVDFGSNTPPAAGSMLSCEVEDMATYGAHKIVRGSVVGGGAPASAALGSAGSPRSAQSFPIPADSHQQSIIRQNALQHAKDLVLGMPTIYLGEGWQSKTADQVTKRLIEVAFTLAEFSSGRLELDVQESLATKLTKT